MLPLANCRFEHPGANNSNSNAFGGRPNNNANPFGGAPSSNNANPFSAPSNNNNNNNNRFGAFGSGATNNNASRSDDNPYKITKASIEIDLAQERPTWILSCYGPGRDAPEQLFGGPDREQSLEEARLFVMSQPDPQAAYGKIQALYQQAEQQMQNAVGNLDGAMQFLLAGDTKHPNRHDICKQSVGREGGYSADAGAAQPPAASANPFGQPAPTTTSAFGQPSQPSAFGGGATTSGGTGAFGSSAPAATAAPAFGQPAAFGAKASPWGAASAGTAAATPAFGQSSFGQAAAPSTGGSAFGQPSQMGGASAFGQPSALGAKPNPFGSGGSTQSAFGQPAQPSTTGAFGQPAQPSTTGAFGQPAQSSTTGAFGQPAQLATTSAFGQPSTLGQKANPFGAPAPAASGFGQAPASSPFGQAASANQGMSAAQPAAAAAANPFGQPSSGGFGSTAVAGSNPFGQKPAGTGFGSAPAAAAAPAANPFGQPQPPAQAAPQGKAPGGSAPASASANPYGPNSQKQHPPLDSYVAKDVSGRMGSFRGQPVVYRYKVGEKYADSYPDGGDLQQYPPAAGIRNQDGSWRRILFPLGPPGYNKDTETDDPAKYTAQIKAAYAISASRGVFEGDVPECPPLREDCVWNF